MARKLGHNSLLHSVVRCDLQIIFDFNAHDVYIYTRVAFNKCGRVFTSYKTDDYNNYYACHKSVRVYLISGSLSLTTCRLVRILHAICIY